MAEKKEVAKMAKAKQPKKEKTTVVKPKHNKMTMTVYDIVPMVDGVSDIRLSENLHNALNLTGKIKDRLMKLSGAEEDKDSDFIPNFNYKGNFLFGPFVRLNAGQGSAVLVEHLDKKTVGINEMIKEADDKTAGSLASTAFFCVSGDLLVLTSGRTNFRALETYINWLLSEHDLEDKQIRFIPKKNIADAIQLRNIKSIELGETFLTPKSNKPSETVKFERFKEEALRLLFGDVKNANDYAWEDIISATLILKVRRRGNEKENSAALDTALRIVDSDEVIITSKDNKRIRGTEYLISAVRLIEQIGLGYYNENQIETEMRAILKAVKNGEVVS